MFGVNKLIEKLVTEKKEWKEVINKFSNNDIYYDYDFYTSFSTLGDGEPNLYFMECEQGTVAYPYMLRRIDTNKIDCSYPEIFDISSVYGYGGPLYCLGDEGNISALKNVFSKNFEAYCLKSNIISQFDRFHPLLENHIFFENYEEIQLNRKTIAIELFDREMIWDNIHPKCKNMIRKAKKSNIKCVINDKKETLSEFIDIYYETMINNNADNYYFFEKNFFETSQALLDEKLIICNAYLNDEVICSILVLVSENYLHYYLSGSKMEYRSLQPNSLLLYEISNWGSEFGKKFFHLGGGILTN